MKNQEIEFIKNFSNEKSNEKLYQVYEYLLSKIKNIEGDIKNEDITQSTNAGR
jgi:hypothetical protein